MTGREECVVCGKPDKRKLGLCYRPFCTKVKTYLCKYCKVRTLNPCTKVKCMLLQADEVPRPKRLIHRRK